MTVERISFESGLPLVPGEKPQLQVLRALSNNCNLVVYLPAAEYDLTPSAWKDNTRIHTHNHNLVVHPDGTGTYRMLPRDCRSAVVDLSTRTTTPGGRIERIPQDKPLIIIAGGMDDNRIGIFEVILYSPGPSPV